jgi:hypothetical protein
MKIYRRGTLYYYEDLPFVYSIPQNLIAFKKQSETETLVVIDGLDQPIKRQIVLTNSIVGIAGEPYSDNFEGLIQGLNEGTDVNVSDQHTPVVIVPFNQPHGTTLTTAAASIDTKTFTVADTTDMTIGDLFTVWNVSAVRFSNFRILNIVGSVITVDSLIDFDYPSGSFAAAGHTNITDDGSITPSIYGLRGIAPVGQGLPLEFDVTRIIFVSRTDTAVDLAKFCDIPALTNGLLMRVKNGLTFNVFNIKSNAGIGAIAYDLTVHDAQNLNQGQHGLVARLTFAGQSKIGVAIRLKAGEDLQVINQDDLTDIAEFSIIAEGHVVDP